MLVPVIPNELLQVTNTSVYKVHSDTEHAVASPQHNQLRENRCRGVLAQALWVGESGARTQRQAVQGRELLRH